MQKYDHKKIERKWQKFWEQNSLYEAKDSSDKKKYYTLVEFPYPSGDGLHVGHARSYTALDAITRWHRMQGKNVLYPIGWDAFGLPTENYAIKNKIHPRVATDRNVKNFRKQLKALGLSFDWTREVDTTDPKYYRWTQWIFLQLYKAGMAYRAEVAINWCPKCKTGLANEEAVDGKHERCGTPVVKKMMKQWLLRITKYADRLLSDLDKVDFPERVKVSQINWIGKSEGAKIKFALRMVPGQNDDKHNVEVFTTRPDTLFGATFIVVSPELAKKWIDVGWQATDAVKKYINKALAKSELDRQDENKEKTGVDTGIKAIHPMTGEELPVWVADYVLGSYGTGAIMGVPAHDQRDFEFARKFKLSIKKVIEPLTQSPLPKGEGGRRPGERSFEGQGKLFNSEKYNGLDSIEAAKKITADLENKGKGEKSITYKLRDWVFSRQHYWGEPIPLIFCEACKKQVENFKIQKPNTKFSKGEMDNPGWIAVEESKLPVELPKVKSYEPTDTGESPLASIKKFVNTTCPRCGGKAKRETDTMPNWAGSNWYFIRYTDPHNDKEFAARDKMKYWLGPTGQDAALPSRSSKSVGGVDLYNGGMEHTTLHLLYSRFIYKFLYDQKLVPGPEPYVKRTSHGIILASDGRKMSKSFGNVINPDEIVSEYGADTLRMYEMFLAPFDQMVPWDERGVVGVRRFLDRLWKHYSEKSQLKARNSQEDKLIHKLTKKITSDLADMKFNTAIAAFMSTLNEMEPLPATSYQLQAYLRLLAPFAPHITEELWQIMGGKSSIHEEKWPEYDEKMLVEDTLKIVVQVNGKMRDTIEMPANLDENEIENQALNSPKVEACIAGKEIVKRIHVKGRLVNFVVK